VWGAIDCEGELDEVGYEREEQIMRWKIYSWLHFGEAR
jgi:hypothetical protein